VVVADLATRELEWRAAFPSPLYSAAGARRSERTGP